MRRRVLLILGTMLLGVMLLGGVALAKTITGTNGPDRLIGTSKKDRITGLGGADYLAGKQKADELKAGRGRDEVRAGNGRDSVAGGGGRDEVYGGGGNDTINAQDGYEDAVNCGIGTDTAYVDKRDVVNRDCENVFGAGQPKPDKPETTTPATATPPASDRLNNGIDDVNCSDLASPIPTPAGDEDNLDSDGDGTACELS